MHRFVRYQKIVSIHDLINLLWDKRIGGLHEPPLSLHSALSVRILPGPLIFCGLICLNILI